MTHIASHSLIWVLMALAVYTPGRLFEQRHPVPGLRHTTRWIVGLAWWSIGLFVLASVGAFSILGLTAWGLLTVAAGIRIARRPVPRAESSSPRIKIWMLIALVVAPLFLIALGPVRSWDAEVYHLSIPKLYVEHGGFRNVEMSLYSHWPMGTQLFFGAAMVLQDFMTAKLVHFGFGLLVLLTLVEHSAGSSRTDPPRAGPALAAALLFLANDVVLFEMRSAYVDLATTFYVLAAFLFLHRAVDADHRNQSRMLGLAGVAAALLAGTKITGVVMALILAAIYLPRAIRDTTLHGFYRGFRPLVAWYALPLSLGLAPWLAKTAWLTGNPFYPALWATLGGPDWSPAIAHRFAEWQQSIGMGREAMDYLLLLPRVILHGAHGYGTFDGKIGAFWIVLLPVAAVITLWTRDRLGGRALVTAGLLFVFWAVSSQQMRFLIPVLPLVVLATVTPLRSWPKVARVAPWVACLFLVVAADYPTLAQSGLRHGLIFTSTGFDPSRAEPEVAGAVDRLPEQAKILLLQSNRRFALNRDVLADSFFEASQIVDWLGDCRNADEVEHRLRNRGVTHILIALRPPMIQYPAPLNRLLADPGRIRPVHRDQRHLLLELLPEG